MNRQLLRAHLVLAVPAQRRILVDGAVLIEADGTIGAVGDAALLIAAHPGVPVRHLRDRLLMPGLVNAHCHSGLLRGTAEGLPVWEWLQRFIDPMHRVLTAEDAEAASVQVLTRK